MSRRGTYDLKYGFIPDEDCPRVPKPQTNADRIRSMTDEEMAEFFRNTTFCDSCFIFKNECGTEKYSCKQRWIDWLKQEADA